MSRATAKKSKELRGVFQRVGRGERVVLRKRKKPIAAVMPIKDLRLLDKIEDRFDAELARKALAEPGRREDYQEFFRKLGSELVKV